MLRSFFVLSLLVAFLNTFSQTPDPGIGGPLAVASLEYDLGDEAFDTPSFPDAIEVIGNVHYPEALDGPYPVLVFLHGRHSTCYNPAIGWTNISWPCTGSYVPIPSYQGYDYLGEFFAGLGYVVISISANSISSTDNSTADYGMQARGELIQHHLDLWNEWNTTDSGPFDSLFIGQLDLSNIGTMGHSRGGEGVVYNALHNRSLGSPYGINAVLTLAPVDFNRQVLGHTPLLNIAPYCDGDVSDLQGVHFFDDVRYNDLSDTTAKHNLLLLGGNHNFFNTVWTPGLFPAGTADDWEFVDWSQGDDHCGTSSVGNGRLDPEAQRNSLLAYSAAFFRYYIGGETEYFPLLNTEDIIPPASATLDDTEVFMSFHPSNQKMAILNALTDEGKEDVNNLGADAYASGLVTYDICGDDLGEQFCLDAGSAQEPHSKSGGILMPGLSQLLVEWNNTDDLYGNELTAAFQDISAFDAIQFRAALDFTEADNALDYSVRLTDASGNTSDVLLSEVSNAMYFPPGDIGTTLPRAMHNTIRVGLDKFSGVDLGAITNVELVFNQDETGSILLADILLSSNERVFLPPLADFIPSVDTTCTGQVTFTDLSSYFPDEWLWYFGDGSTSTEEEPMHEYTLNGTYTVSLTVSNSAGTDTQTLISAITVNRPDSPLASSATICPGDSVHLSATPLSGGQLQWFADAEEPFATGEEVSLFLESDTTFYVQEVVDNPVLSAGPEDNTFGGGSYFDGNDLRGIFFDVFRPLTIETVLVYAGSSGTRTIQVLEGEGGPVVNSIDVALTAGEQVVVLDFPMLPGEDYFIKVTGDLVDLFRINDGSPDYPYEIPGLISLKRSNVDGDEEDYYYFFFNWQVREPACLSPLQEVAVTVHPLPEVTTSGDVSISSGGSATLTATGGLEYSWTPEDGLSDPDSPTTNASPSVTTTYTVMVTDENGCTAMDSLVVTVQASTGLDQEEQQDQFHFYPNPASQNLYFSGLQSNTNISLIDATGRMVINMELEPGDQVVSLMGLPPGIYLLQWTTASKQGTSPLIVE